MAPRSGRVASIPNSPKQSMDVRRPTRSERAPNAGCSNMKPRSAAVMMFVATFALKCAVFTRYFCMYVVNV
jgi:hypothetical protein